MAILAPEAGPTRSVGQKEVALYSETEYFSALIRDVNSTKSGDRIGIMTMSFEPSEPAVNKLVERLYAAADRKVEVVLGIDAFTFLVDDSRKTVGPLWLPLPFGQDAYRHRLAALDRLSVKPSGSYGVINKPSGYLSNPYSGRSHLKTAVVNDKVYLGGPNLHMTDRSDMVVGLEDPEVADWLFSLTKNVVEAERTSDVLGDADRSIEVDGNTRILLDSGTPGESLILDEAARLIAEAREGLIASFQYFPDGKVADELINAHRRGASVRPFFKHPDRHNLVLGIHQRLAMMLARSRMPGSFFANVVPVDAPVLHSKAIASERAAMVGSHNYVTKGVKYGTPEIALLREDPVFARAVGDLLLKQARAVSPEPELEMLLTPAPREVLST